MSNLTIGFVRSNPPATSSEAYQNSHIITLEDSAGKRHFYRIRIYEFCENNAREQIALTNSQWRDVVASPMEKTLKKVIDSAKGFIPNHVNLKINNDGIEASYSQDSSFQTTKLEDDKNLAKQFCDSVLKLNQAPPLPEEMKNAELTLNLNSSPIGIDNEGNDCFISAYLQAFVLDDQPITQVLWNQREKGKAAELGRFLHNYQSAQSTKKSATGVHAVRDALCRANKIKKHVSGQHDPTEAFGFLNENKFRTSHFQKETIKYYWKIPEDKNLQTDFPGASKDDGGVYTTTENNDFNGTVPVIYKKGKSLEDLLKNSLEAPHDKREIQPGVFVTGISQKRTWEKTPAHLIGIIGAFQGDINNAEKLTLDSVNDTIELGADYFPDKKKKTYELTSFIQHKGVSGGSGHYVAYVKRGEKYFECNDATITEKKKDEFLEAAKTLYAAKYTLKKNSPSNDKENDLGGDGVGCVVM